jgi:N-acetylglucosamine kinase-like BadF-type ATPase
MDAGQSACRVFIRDKTGREYWVEAEGVVSGRDPLAAVVDAVGRATASIDYLSRAEAIDTVAIGLTGLHGRAADAQHLLDQLHGRYGTSRAMVADDSVTSFFGALGPGPGVVVAAGTGVCVLAIDRSGRHRRVDGWGPLLGDAGGGYWIGSRGLAEAVRACDGRKGSPALLDLLKHRAPDVSLLPVQLAADPKRVAWTAAFARDVAAAARDGDEAARSIWVRSSQLLAESVEATARPLFGERPVTVSYTGRLFNAGDLLVDPFVAEVRRRLPSATVVPALGTSLDGAVYLAELDSPPDLPPLLTVATTGRD